MSVSPAPHRGWRALSALALLLTLLVAAGCAARDRSEAVPTPTPTATVTPTFTPDPTTQVEGVYTDLEAHHNGSYRLQRRGDFVEATFMTTRSPVQAGAQPPGQALFTLPPAFRPPFPVLRRVVGQPVRADGSLDPANPDPRPFRLQLAPDGAVRYLDPPAGADLGYLAYSLHLAWGITPAANDRAILRILDRPRFEDLPDGYHQQSGGWAVEIEDGRVTRLKLTDFKAVIPPELGQLSQLKSLTLVRPPYPYKSESGDPWSGPLPPQLGRLVNLIHLDLRDNQLTGAIPPELGQLVNLTYLHLGINQLTGAIPPQLGQLINLTYLDLSRNQLAGPIPTELGRLVNLEKLYLGVNQLTGPLPPQLGQLQNLHTLSLVRTQLTGPIPPELGQLASLTTLHLFENQLTGEIPPQLTQLVQPGRNSLCRITN